MTNTTERRENDHLYSELAKQQASLEADFSGLSSDVKSLTVSVASLAQKFDQNQTAMYAKIDQINQQLTNATKPNVSAWLQAFGVIAVLGLAILGYFGSTDSRIERDYKESDFRIARDHDQELGIYVSQNEKAHIRTSEELKELHDLIGMTMLSVAKLETSVDVINKDIEKTESTRWYYRDGERNRDDIRELRKEFNEHVKIHVKPLLK